MTKRTVLVLGGDKRMIFLADLFAKEYNSYICYNESMTPRNAAVINALSEISKIDIVILPIPSFDKDGILTGTSNISAEKLFSTIPSNTLIFGAKISDLHRHLAKEYGHRLLDYGENERFNTYNAIPTAEGAMLIAMQNSETTIYESNFIVMGYGRIGKFLSKILRELGGKVTVVSRNDKSLALAECEGLNTMQLNDFCNSPVCCDICFNTIPSNILTEKETRKWEFRKYIELASFPGGLTETAKNEIKDRYISALSLPGKYFPTTSGKIIYKTIISMISSHGGK